MTPVPAVERQESSMSRVKNTYAMTDRRIAVTRYIESDWLFASLCWWFRMIAGIAVIMKPKLMKVRTKSCHCHIWVWVMGTENINKSFLSHTVETYPCWGFHG